jgi:hypothetical protein
MKFNNDLYITLPVNLGGLVCPALLISSTRP